MMANCCVMSLRLAIYSTQKTSRKTAQETGASAIFNGSDKTCFAATLGGLDGKNAYRNLFVGFSEAKSEKERGAGVEKGNDASREGSRSSLQFSWRAARRSAPRERKGEGERARESCEKRGRESARDIGQERKRNFISTPQAQVCSSRSAGFTFPPLERNKRRDVSSRSETKKIKNVNLCA